MNIVFHHDLYRVYASGFAAAPGSVESIVNGISVGYESTEPAPAHGEDVAAVHGSSHIDHGKGLGLSGISALAPGGAIEVGALGLTDTCFALTRPAGHHASADTSWGFRYFNNIAIAVEKLRRVRATEKAFIPAIDPHFGDGTVTIFETRDYVSIFNPRASPREDYVKAVEVRLGEKQSDIVGISAGFDNHRHGWDGLLETGDRSTRGTTARETCEKKGCGFGL